MTKLKIIIGVALGLYLSINGRLTGDTGVSMSQFPRNSQATQTQTIVAGVLADFPPQYSTDKQTGKPGGFAIDIMEAIAEQSGLEVRYVVFDTWAELFQAIEEKRVDVIPNMGITADRQDIAIFTSSVETFPIHIFVRAATNDIQSVEDLRGHAVSVVKLNVGVSLMQEQQSVTMILHNDISQALLSLLSGQSDAIVFPAPVLNLVARNAGLEDKIKTVGHPLLEIKRAIAVRRDQPELAQRLDSAVQSFVNTPQYYEIYTRWYGKPKPFWDAARVAITMSSLLLITIVGLAAWRYVSIMRLNMELSANIAERKQVEKSLRESEERFRTLVENSVAGILVHRDTKPLFINPAYIRILGYESLAEILAMDSVISLIAPYEQERLLNYHAIRIKGESAPNQYEYDAVCKDGSIVTLQQLVTTIPWDDEPAVLAAIIDITERKQAEETLRESEARFRQIIDTTQAGYFYIDRDGRFRHVNEAWLRMHKYDSREEVIGRHFALTQVEADMEEAQKTVTLLLEGVLIPTSEFTRRCRDGTIGYHTFSAGPVVQGGEVVGLEGFIIDTTERKEAEERLREREQRLASIYDTVGDVIFQLAVEPGNQYRFISVNQAFSNVAGLSFEQVAGKMVNEIIPEPALTIVLRNYSRSIEEKTIVRWEETSDYPTGRLTGEVSIAPVFDDAGVCTHLVGAVHDITERKRAEETLRQYTQRLQALHQIDRAILAAKSPKAIAQAALSYIRELIPCRRASITEFDLQANKARILAVEIDGNTKVGIEEPIVPLRFQGIETLKQGQTHVVDDIAALSQRSPQEQLLQAEGIRSYINTPLLVRDELIGSLNLGVDSPGFFTAEHLNIAGQVGASLAVAVQQARLYEQARQDARIKTELLQEVNHRVKNNLMAISGLFMAEKRYASAQEQTPVAAAMARLNQRLQGLAEVHTILSQSEWAPVSLSDLVNRIIHLALKSLLAEDQQVQVEVAQSSLEVSPRQAGNLALVINELATNTAKYVLPPDAGGTTARITVNLALEGDMIRLEYRDNGPGYPVEMLSSQHYDVAQPRSTDKTISSVGLYLIQRIVTRTLRGRLTLANNNGAITIIQFKTEERSAT